jgi:RNA pol II promoter Fmp27 protein domain
MHQREEEFTAPGPIPNTTRIVRRKPFYAAEVIMKGIELRAMLANFPEPLKRDVRITASDQRSNYRKHADLPITTSTSTWYDLEDFVGLDWLSSRPPVLHLLPLATFPHFTYFKRNTSLPGVFPQTSKFGSEHSHICLLGEEQCRFSRISVLPILYILVAVLQTQISLVSARVTELKKSLQGEATLRGQKGLTVCMLCKQFVDPCLIQFKPSSRSSVKKMLALLEEYIAALRETEVRPDDPQTKEPQNYHIPTDIVSPDEWAEFDNVYQIHCPSVFMDSAVRDVCLLFPSLP